MYFEWVSCLFSQLTRIWAIILIKSTFTASLKREDNQTKSSFDIDNALDYYIHNEGDVDDDDINFIIIIVIIIFIINININIIEKKKLSIFF